MHDIDVYKEAAPDNLQRVRLEDKRIINGEAGATQNVNERPPLMVDSVAERLL